MSTIYSNKELRFFRLTKGVVDYATEASRIAFQQEWNDLYPRRPWRNDRANGQQLLAEERARGSRLYDPVYSVEYKLIKDNLETGDVQEWDVTTLVFALKYSHALCRSRSSRRGRTIGNALNQIRKVRNCVIAHAKRTSISRSIFERHINTLLRAVKDLLTKSHSLVKKLKQLKNETQFQTEDLLRYEKQLKDDRSGLLSLDKLVERLESKLKNPNGPEIDRGTPAYKAGSDHKNSENSEIILRLQTRMARIISEVDISPSKTRPDIFHRKEYIEMIRNCYFLGDMEWIRTYLDGISSDNDIDMKLYAEIEWATALDYGPPYGPIDDRSKALEVLDSLVPYVGSARNGVVIYARIKIRKSTIPGNDDDVMKELDEAEKMLSLTECHDDIAELNIRKAAVLLDKKHLRTIDQAKLFMHCFEKARESCKKAPTDKTNRCARELVEYYSPFYEYIYQNSPQGVTRNTLKSYRRYIARQ